MTTLDSLEARVHRFEQGFGQLADQHHALQVAVADGLLPKLERMDKRIADAEGIAVLAMASVWLLQTAKKTGQFDAWICPACQEQFTCDLIAHARVCGQLLDDVRSDGPPRPPRIV